MRPSRALLHPLWLASLLLLVFNDHVLKPYAPEPRWFIAKASDFAGLIVLPPLLAALVRARSERALHWIHGAVALGFASIKTVPAASVLYERGLWFVGAANVVDPSDLIALVVMPLGLAVLGPVMHRPVTPGRLHQVAAVAGALACIATSKPRTVVGPCPPDGYQSEDVSCRPAFTATMSIGNAGVRTRTVQLRTPRDDDATICQDVAAAVNGSGACFDEARFEQPRWITLRVTENRAIEGAARDGCAIAMVRFDEWRPWTLVLHRWGSGPAPVGRVPFTGIATNMTGVWVDVDADSIRGTVEVLPLRCPEAP